MLSYVHGISPSIEMRSEQSPLKASADCVQIILRNGVIGDDVCFSCDSPIPMDFHCGTM